MGPPKSPLASAPTPQNCAITSAISRSSCNFLISRQFRIRKALALRSSRSFRPHCRARVARHDNKPDVMAANQRLKVARVLRGLTQLQLAERVGTKEIDISRFETGRCRPDDEMKH